MDATLKNALLALFSDWPCRDCPHLGQTRHCCWLRDIAYIAFVERWQKEGRKVNLPEKWEPAEHLPVDCGIEVVGAWCPFYDKAANSCALGTDRPDGCIVFACTWLRTQWGRAKEAEWNGLYEQAAPGFAQTAGT